MIPPDAQRAMSKRAGATVVGSAGGDSLTIEGGGYVRSIDSGDRLL